MPHYKQSDIIRLVFTKGQPLFLEKGHVIIGNDPEPDGVYYINTGYVKVYSINDDGSQNTRIIFGPGELFPITWAYLGTQSKMLFYEAMSACLLWRLSRQWFLRRINDGVDISNAMAMQVAQQLNIFVNRVENLEYKRGRERVIYRLLYLASRFGIRENDHIRIEAPITHEIFASTVNLARESVSRELEKLEKQNLIQLHNHAIRLMDVESLAGQLSRPVNLADWYLT